MPTTVDFKHPPVVETVLGLQFKRLRGLTNAHLGAFWQAVRNDCNDWPKVNDAPPVPEQFELFGERQLWLAGLPFRLTDESAARIQAKNEAENRMVQVQNCRLDYNWLGTGGDKYPRYTVVRPEFDKMLGRFREFIAALKLDELLPTQWEVTYVNHMPRGTVWEQPDEWHKVLPGLIGPAGTPAGTKLESLVGQWHFEIPPHRGRLHIVAQHGLVRPPEMTEALIVVLTARGPIEEGAQDAAVGAGLDRGHDVIVNSFSELTSPMAHDYWNREP